jgi:hypothetical protein
MGGGDLNHGSVIVHEPAQGACFSALQLLAMLLKDITAFLCV